MYSLCWRKRPFWGRLVILSHTAQPRQIQPAHCSASVIEGYCRQSMNRQMALPVCRLFWRQKAIQPSIWSSFADPFDLRQNRAGHFLCPCCCTFDWWCGFSRLASTRPKRRRIGNNGVKHLRLECPDYLQGIPVQECSSHPRRCVPWAEWFRQQFESVLSFRSEASSFLLSRPDRSVFFCLDGVFSDNSVSTYSLIMFSAL